MGRRGRPKHRLTIRSEDAIAELEYQGIYPHVTDVSAMMLENATLADFSDREAAKALCDRFARRTLRRLGYPIINAETLERQQLDECDADDLKQKRIVNKRHKITITSSDRKYAILIELLEASPVETVGELRELFPEEVEVLFPKAPEPGE